MRVLRTIICVYVTALTDDDVIGVAGLRHLLDEEVHHAPEVVVLALEQLRHAEKHLNRTKENAREGQQTGNRSRTTTAATTTEQAAQHGMVLHFYAEPRPMSAWSAAIDEGAICREENNRLLQRKRGKQQQR